MKAPEATGGAQGQGESGEARERLLESLESVVEYTLRDQPPGTTARFMGGLAGRLRAQGQEAPQIVSTPYIITISAEEEVPYPGNQEVERRIRSLIRWNAMAMVVSCRRSRPMARWWR